MTWLQWLPGRQGTGYRKLLLFQSKRFYFDAYLIDYSPETYIPTHTDPFPGRRHFRLNITLFGEDAFRGTAIFATKRIKLFRPDIAPHSVERVSKRRMVLSIGWARSER